MPRLEWVVFLIFKIGLLGDLGIERNVEESNAHFT